MKIYVTGYTHLSGTSKKTGKDYDFYQVETLSRRNSGIGSPLMTNIMAIQAPAFDNILADFLEEYTDYPVLLSAEFDNRGSLVEVSLICDGEDATAELLEALNG